MSKAISESKSFVDIVRGGLKAARIFFPAAEHGARLYACAVGNNRQSSRCQIKANSCSRLSTIQAKSDVNRVQHAIPAISDLCRSQWACYS